MNVCQTQRGALAQRKAHRRVDWSAWSEGEVWRVTGGGGGRHTGGKH